MPFPPEERSALRACQGARSTVHGRLVQTVRASLAQWATARTQNIRRASAGLAGSSRRKSRPQARAAMDAARHSVRARQHQG